MNLDRLILDNPNLSSGKLEMLTGVSAPMIRLERKKLGINPLWYHRGVGVPFMYFHKSLVAYAVCKGDKRLFAGSFDNAIENVDRLIYCLENNNGKLPLSRREFYVKGLRFLK